MEDYDIKKMGLADRISETELNIGSIKINTDNPFTWASGYRMPFYNDNRMMLADHQNRMLIKEGFLNLIKKNNVEFDFIVGTNTAGIGPAVSVAYDTEKPLLIVNNGSVFEIPSKEYEIEFDENRAFASTCPWAIPTGVLVANRYGSDYMFVRQSQKDHGLKQQIEGMPKQGQSVVLIDLYNKESYVDNAIAALNEKGLIIDKTISEDISDRIKDVDVSGKKILLIEDLFSTGGSAVAEVKTLKDLGAEVEYCFSIFTYDFDITKKSFSEVGCKIESVLDYERLIKNAWQKGKIQIDQFLSLGEWSLDPFSWGEKNGFPKVVKK